MLRVGNKTISKPIVDIIHDLQKRCPGKLSTIKVTGNDIQITCPNKNHKGGREAKASAGIYIGASTDKLKTGFFHCFTCDERGPFEHFVALCFECSEDFAKKWLIENYADASADFLVDLPKITLHKKSPAFLSESILESFQSFHPYMNERKLSLDLCKRFQISYDPASECLVFPVRNEKGRLVMLTRRSVKEKKFIIDKDIEKPLYLLNNVLQDSPTKFMIAEGQIDAVSAYGFGMPCVATIGAISDKQIAILNNSGVRTLYIMFDGDFYGNKFKEKLLKKLKPGILPICVPIIVAGRKDINDLSKEEFWQCVHYAESNCI